MPVTEDTKPKDNLGGFTDYKQEYGSMKLKLKAVLYENELFRDELRKLQRELLDIYRDKETLLERIVQYEDIGSSSSDSESQSSDNECDIESVKIEPQTVLTDKIATTKQQKTLTVNKKRNVSPPQNVFVTAAKRNNNGNDISTKNTGAKTIANGVNQTNTTNFKSGSKNKSVVPKTDSQPANGSSTSTNKNAAPLVKPQVNPKPQVTPKPKAPRNRTKATATSACKNGSKVTPVGGNVSKTNTVKNQKQKVADNNSVPTVNDQIQIVIDPHSQSHLQTKVRPQLQHQPQIQLQSQPQLQTQHQLHLQPQSQNLPQIQIQTQLQGPLQLQTQLQPQLQSQLRPHLQHQLQTQIQTQQLQPQIVPQRLQLQQQLQQQPHIQQIQQQQSLSNVNCVTMPSNSGMNFAAQQPIEMGASNNLLPSVLPAEELELHLEIRRMEQASLLLPEWESSVPNEIFNTDAVIKFMAED